MKRLYALLLCLVLLLSCAALPALADEPVTLDMTLITNANYNHGDPNADRSVYDAIEEKLGIKLNITWISSEGSKEKISTMIASNSLPDIFAPGLTVASLVEEGAIMALDPYIDQIDNYMKRLPKDVEVSLRNVSDGLLYQVNMLTDYKPAYTMCYRQDWLDNLGVEKVPETIDEWLAVWRLVRDNDANKNGDPNDEVPFVDPPTFTSGVNGASLLLLWGVKSNGAWYSDDEGHYSMVQEHECYREYLELMRTLYSEKLIDQELFTNNATAVATLFNSNMAFSGYQWISRPQNTTKTLAATIPEVHLAPTVPIKGENGAQMIPQRNLAGSSFVFSYALENNKAKLDAALRLINFMYSDEGVFLTNWGIEGNQHTLVDGKPVLNDTIVSDPSFTAARYAGLVCQQFPTMWIYDNYNQILTGNKPLDAMSFADQQMYEGTQINWDYYFVAPPTLSTPASVQYGADIFDKVAELRANCITGQISVDDFFAGYEALKPYGLQEILDEAQEYYTKLFTAE